MSLVSEAADLSKPLRAGLAEPSLAGVEDYVALLKPRVMSLVVFTALVGLLIAPGHVHPVIGFTALFCIAIGAGAAGALNMWYDADIDAVMARTAQRPVPTGRIQPGEALGFGMTLAIGSVATLGLLVNWAGAFPPVVGWAAATGQIGFESVLLFFIIFIWTPPHFWALSLSRTEEYARAGVPMLPVVAGREATCRQIVLYSVALMPAGAAPWLFGYAGLGYGLFALAAGALMLLLAWRLHSSKGDMARGRAGKQLFFYSILYLALVFAALLAEHEIGVLLGRAA